MGLRSSVRRLAVVSIALVLLAWPMGQVSHGADAKEPLDVSLVQLIATPAQYNQRLVRVSGFCHLEREADAIYLHPSDAEWLVTKNGVFLAIGWPQLSKDREALRADLTKRLSDRYVLIEATFDAGPSGHLEAFSGTLRDIRRLERLPTRDELRHPPSRRE